MNNQTELIFNQESPTVMHVDLNACFASIEQQANHLLRNKPVAVAAYASSNGCILAASYEAKRLGVKTGMRVKDGKLFCPDLIVLSPDPHKYRHIHRAFRKLLKEYTYDFVPKSIDEFVLHFDKTLSVHKKNMVEIGQDLKKRIKSDIGDYLTVSVGISTNRFLAKQAAGITKPDGLDVIDLHNFEETYKKLHIMTLTGIKERNFARLSPYGLTTVWDMYEAPLWKLRAAFKSINSYYWYTRLRGYEIDRVAFQRRSYGNSYSLPKPFSKEGELTPILTKLVTKTSGRLRHAGLAAHGIHLAISYRDGDFVHEGHKTPHDLYTTTDIYRVALSLLKKFPKKPVRNIAVSVFDLRSLNTLQLSLLTDTLLDVALTQSIDTVNNRYGAYTVSSARMLPAKENVPDRIAFGNVKELEEIMGDSI